MPRCRGRAARVGAENPLTAGGAVEEGRFSAETLPTPVGTMEERRFSVETPERRAVEERRFSAA